MNPEARKVRKSIAGLEKERRRLEKMIAHYRQILDLLLKPTDAEAHPARPRAAKKPTTPAPAPAPAPFSPKYARTARDYISDLLSEKGAMALREIRACLAERDLHYSEQALALSMKNLEKADLIVRRRAARGSTMLYVYEVKRTAP